MTLISSVTCLQHTVMTETVRNIKRPNSFLQSLLFSNRRTHGTEAIEIGHKTAGRTMAPLIHSGSEAKIVGGMDSQIRLIKPPNIKIKTEFNPQRIFFDRQPGQPIFVPSGGEGQLSGAEQYVADELQQMDYMIVNTTEWLCAQMLQGGVSYAVADKEYYSITVPRSASHNISPTVFWDDANPDLPEVLIDLMAIKEVLSESESLAVTDAICGTEAAEALMRLVAKGKILMLGLNGRDVSAGQMTFVSQFTEDGTQFLGELSGIRFWKYVRSATWEGGAGPGGTTPQVMIRPKYIEFVSTSPQSERVLEYGGIPEVIDDKLLLAVTDRFAKSWGENDPAKIYALLASRPLPWPRRPDATISFKAVSG